MAELRDYQSQLVNRLNLRPGPMLPHVNATPPDGRQVVNVSLTITPPRLRCICGARVDQSGELPCGH